MAREKRRRRGPWAERPQFTTVFSEGSNESEETDFAGIPMDVDDIEMQDAELSEGEVSCLIPIGLSCY